MGTLDGKVALVTGSARKRGIGRAIALRLAREGADVVVSGFPRDPSTYPEHERAEDWRGAPSLAAEIRALGRKAVALDCDVTQARAVQALVDAALHELGGLDIVVNNAGIAIPAPVEDTSLELWNKQMAILGTGYFLVGREGFRILKRQNNAGSMIFIASKNGVVASAGTSAYGAIKAAEIHLARVMALEGAPHGIRVNTVNPDAVLRGSKIMSETFRKSRAESLKIRPDELEEHYRKRSLLQRSVFPEDIAEAVYFFASDASFKSTGNMLNVDAGHLASFTR